MTERATERAAIEELSADFGYHLDHGGVTGFLAIFAADATYTSGTRRLQGHAEIAGFFEKRALERRTSRHFHGMIRLRFDGVDRATGFSSWITYSAASPTPVVGTAPAVVADVEDVYVRQDGEWRISERKITPVFVAAAAL